MGGPNPEVSAPSLKNVLSSFDERDKISSERIVMSQRPNPIEKIFPRLIAWYIIVMPGHQVQI